MTIIEAIPILNRYAKFLTKNYFDEDYRDLVQDTLAKLIGSNIKDFSEGYIITVCKNTWKDKLAYRAVRQSTFSIETYLNAFVDFKRPDEICLPDEFCTQPDVEEQIECKELGFDWYNWNRSTKCTDIAEILRRKYLNEKIYKRKEKREPYSKIFETA